MRCSPCAWPKWRRACARCSAPSAELVAALWRAHGVQPAWLLTGEGPAYRAGTQLPGAAAAESDGLVPVQRLDITASAGPGAVNEPAAEYSQEVVSLHPDWLRKRGLQAQQLRAIRIRGTSMQPVLADGDWVLVDLSHTHPHTGYVYLLRQSDELRAKYLELLPSGLLRVSSANASFAPYELDLASTPHVQVIGRVVASLHDL
jgi:phage repressor protein C with HTH and peptisase S24 domain